MTIKRVLQVDYDDDGTLEQPDNDDIEVSQTGDKNIHAMCSHTHDTDKELGANNGQSEKSKPVAAMQSPGCTDHDMDKVKTTVKQFYRDWSSAGKAERDACYKPVIDEIQRLFPLESK